MKTLVLANQKGGVGKSAVATLLAHYLVRHGRRVLSIDLDHQGNFSSPLALSKRVCVAATTADRLLTQGCASVPHQTHVLVPAAVGYVVLARPTVAQNDGVMFLSLDRPGLETVRLAFERDPDRPREYRLPQQRADLLVVGTGSRSDAVRAARRGR